MLNPLLADLQDEITEVLIREGNLKKEKAKPAFIAQWTHQGYVAHIQEQYCACGARRENLIGIFSREVSATGENRDTALTRGFQIPLGQNHPVEVSQVTVAVCPSCLSSKGFSWKNYHEHV